MSNIIIDIEQSADASAYEIGYIIHQKEFESVRTKVEKQISHAVNSFETMKEPGLPKNNTITVFGERGTGKTSFIKSIKQFYEKDTNYQNKVEQLELIDPTMVEEKGHFFLTVIALIDKKVRAKLELSENRNLLNDWQKNVSNLAYGIPSIDGVGGNHFSEHDWQDPEYIMHHGLASVSVAFELSKKFHHFLYEALKHLEKKVFLVAFDDIDVDFRKGWPILEMIRKYFTSELLITIVSGDIRLFSLAIRKNKWKNFGKELLINEGGILNKIGLYNNRVTEMENQYLLKILKPENRVQLSSLKQKVYEIDEKQRDNYLIKYNDERENENITNRYDTILSRFGINNKYQRESYKSFLLALPIRTQIQFLSIFSNSDENIRPVVLIMPFLSDLFQKDVDIDLIQNNTKLINSEILTLLLKERDLSGAYQLMPTTNDDSRNASLFALNLYSSYYISKDPFQIFDYLIKVGYVRNLLSNFPYKDAESDKVLGYDVESVHDLCNHSGVYQDKSLRDIVGNMNAYIGAFDKKKNSKSEFGLISIDALSIKTKKSKAEDANRLDKILSSPSITKIQEILGYMPFSISESSKTNSSSAIYSIFTLIGSIGEIIRKNEVDSLNSGIAELSQVRTFIMPDIKSGPGKFSEIVPLIESDRIRESNDISALVHEVKLWINRFNKNGATSVHVLGKASTRFFYALNAIEKMERNSGLGQKMHRRIIALLNSVLYEDAIENISSSINLNNNNPVKEDTIFFANLNEILKSNETEKLSFSKWFLSCPVLLSYLNPESKSLKEIYRYCKHDNSNFIKGNSLFTILEHEKSGIDSEGAGKGRRSTKNEKVVELFREQGIPLTIFKKMDGLAATREANNEIRIVTDELLKKSWSAIQINDFRKYLLKHKLI